MPVEVEETEGDHSSKGQSVAFKFHVIIFVDVEYFPCCLGARHVDGTLTGAI